MNCLLLVIISLMLIDKIETCGHCESAWNGYYVFFECKKEFKAIVIMLTLPRLAGEACGRKRHLDTSFKRSVVGECTSVVVRSVAICEGEESSFPSLPAALADNCRRSYISAVVLDGFAV